MAGKEDLQPPARDRTALHVLQFRPRTSDTADLASCGRWCYEAALGDRRRC